MSSTLCACYKSDLRESIKDNKFREDLFYRINVASVTMPPLRTRPEDIGEIVEYFCRRLSAEMGRAPLHVHPDAMKLLKDYDWPGNVRELKNILEACIMLGDAGSTEITVRDLPPELLAVRSADGSGQLMDMHDRHEKEELLRVLRQSNGNQTQAAKIMGCHRNTIRAKIRYYGLSDVTPQ